MRGAEARRAQFVLLGMVATEFLPKLHETYVLGLDKDKETFEYQVTEHLRVSGVYWGLAAMDVLGRLDAMDRDGVIEYVASLQKPSGGFAGNTGHDEHMLYTLSAVQVLAMYDALDRIDVDKCVQWVSSLQRPDGSFQGDKWGEIDTRFTYCVFNCLALLHRLDAIHMDRAVDYVIACRNFDGGFGCTPGAESHAGQIFCCVGALAIANRLDVVDRDLLGWWLCERQVKGGGLNGRPEKKPDVCYSWWVLSSLSIIDRLHWIDNEALRGFIIACQDEETGGFSDRPGDMVDVFHTFFGVAGLALMGFEKLNPIDPIYALTSSTVKRLRLPLPDVPPHTS